MFVRESDEAVLIGPADPEEGTFGSSPYLDLAELEQALRACRAEAVWPGWGFVSERAEFAELCERLGIVFIGPSSAVMRRLGDKIESKRLADEVGVPMAPWSGGPVADVDGRARGGREDRLSPDGQGHRRRGRARDPVRVRVRVPRGGRRPGGRRGRADRGRRHGLPRGRGRGRAARRGPGRRRRRGWRVDPRGARLQRPAPQPEGHRGVGVHGTGRRSRTRSCARRPPTSRGRRATSTRAPSSSSTSPTRSCCRSWRSTPGCRSSTRSPRRPPASTSSSSSCTWPWAARSPTSRRPRPPSAGTPSRRAWRRRIPSTASRRLPAASSISCCRPAPASASTPGSRRATSSRRSSTP